MIIEKDDVPFFCFPAAGVEFTLSGIPQDRQQWLDEVLTAEFARVVRTVERETMAYVRKDLEPLRRLLL